ncbi:hypothetical protein QE152_g35666 [Popillia japonica]|uniref:Uncharacterized protein n=1 Tax=Popillia japonica TaxID=7064 RepID=A0AAW1IFI2_POPJA
MSNNINGPLDVIDMYVDPPRRVCRTRCVLLTRRMDLLRKSARRIRGIQSLPRYQSDDASLHEYHSDKSKSARRIRGIQSLPRYQSDDASLHEYHSDKIRQ